MPLHIGDDGKSISGSASKVGGLSGSAREVGDLSGSASDVGVGVCSSGVAEAVLDVATPSHTGNDGKSISSRTSEVGGLSGSASKVGGLSGSASKVGVGECSLGVAEAALDIAMPSAVAVVGGDDKKKSAMREEGVFQGGGIKR
jgi:hypothetical protein